MLFCMIQPVFTFDNLLQRLQLGKDATPFVIWHEKDPKIRKQSQWQSQLQ